LGVLSRLRMAAEMAVFGEVQKSGDAGGWLVRMVGGKTEAGVPVNEWISITYPAVWACVTLIADTIAQLPVDLLRHTSRGRELVNDHPAAALLNESANRDMTASVVRGTQQTHALLWGNGYAEIQRNRRQELIGLWPLMPEATRPDLMRFERDRALVYRTNIEGRTYDLEQDRVLHIKGVTHDGICGLSPIAVARDAVGLGLAMGKFGSMFFANDSKSGGFLLHPGKLGDKAIKNIRDSFNEQGGPDNAFNVKVLEEGTRFVTTTIPPDDAQFLQSRSFQTSEIARIYRVPLVMLQMIEGSTVWGTGIETILIAFTRFTIRPWLVGWEQELRRKLLTEDERRAGFYFKFNINALLAGDSAARASFYNTMVNIGAMTRNEVRALEDLNPRDGLDEPLVPANMQTSRQLEEGGQNAAPDA
jgi:HK97 family phage portal protein